MSHIPAVARFSVERLPDALGWLGTPTASSLTGSLDPTDRLQQLAHEAGLELVAVSARATELRAMIRRGAPAIAPVRDTGEYVVIVSRGSRSVRLLTTELRTVRVRIGDLFDLLCDGARTEPLLELLPAVVRTRARQVLIERLAQPQDIADWWLVRAPPEAPITRLLAEQGVGWLMFAWLLSHGLAFGCWIASFVLIGRGALLGRLDVGWMLGWVLLLATVAPIRASTLWFQGQISVRAGAVLKQRLLTGALRLPPDEVRTLGVGTLLGRVQDSEILERFALDGALGAVLALFELVVAIALFGLSQHIVHVFAVSVFAALVLALALLWRRIRMRWTIERVSLTQELVSGLLGQSTRVIQSPPRRWHEEEDRLLERYTHSSKRADELAVLVNALPMLCLAVCLLLLGPAFVSGTADAIFLATGIGVTLLAVRSIDSLCRGMQDIIGASIAWQEIRSIYLASSEPLSQPAPEIATLPAPSPEEPVMELRSVGFRYSDSAAPILSSVSASIGRRDRVLLQGPSGGGKSTLAAVLLGLREPSAGKVALLGLDRSVWGQEGWRGRVTGAPQFHQNHVLAGTLAFNLLLGRRWPPTERDLADAMAICGQLGLGPLLERMPAGLQQLVGETGWQLSHGERSRVFLARALLQRADVVLLDESTAALDAQSTEWCLYRINAQSAAIIVVAHP